jgi:aminoglycoside phosphotransferase (APT) family kinase protein
MAREFRLLERLHPHFPLAPEPILLCEDPAVLGSVFYLMERRRGLVVRDTLPPSFAGLPEVARRLGTAFVDCLAALHAVDLETTGLLAIGRPEGFLARQVEGWAGRWSRARTEEHGEMEAVIAWLRAERPAPAAPTLVHNDFKLDNLMFSAGDPDTLVAVLDWEMTSVGDPLVDLGLALCYWLERGVIESFRMPVCATPGWFGREEILHRYFARCGRDLSRILWYEVLGAFKLAVIVQQIYARFVRGQTRDERFRRFHLRVAALVRAAAQLIDGGR